MSIIPTPAQAMEWVRRYNQEEFHLHHAKTVGWVLGCLAQSHDPGQEEYWQAVGILHDIDFERWPEEHCKKAQALLQELDVDEALMRPTGFEGMEVKSVMKKFKDKKFAAGCSREVISQGAEMLGLTVQELAAEVLPAMQSMPEDWPG